MFVGSLLVGTSSVLYLLYYINIGLISETQLRIVPREDVATKYLLTWCEAYGSLKYGWEFGEEKFRYIQAPKTLS